MKLYLAGMVVTAALVVASAWLVWVWVALAVTS